MNNNITEQMKDILTDYTDDVMKTVINVLAEVAQDAAKELHTAGDFKNRTGRYRKGWKADQEVHRTFTSNVVYNRTDYQLTHLLEYGHIIRGGKRRKDMTTAFAHVSVVNEHAQEEAIRKITEAIEKIK